MEEPGFAPEERVQPSFQSPLGEQLMGSCLWDPLQKCSGPHGSGRDEDTTPPQVSFQRALRNYVDGEHLQTQGVERFNGTKRAYDAVICVWEDDPGDFWLLGVCVHGPHPVAPAIRGLQSARVANSWVFICLLVLLLVCLINSYRTTVSQGLQFLLNHVNYLAENLL